MVEKIRLRIPQNELNEHQRTDVVLSWNFPFMTLTESKIPNVWYHEHFDWLCVLTSRGFKPLLNSFGGSKKKLFELGYGR